MTKTRKHYDGIFKENAVKLSYERKNLSELARELGIEPTLLYRWRNEYGIYSGNSFPGNGNLKSLKCEWIYGYKNKTMEQMKQSIFSYIEIWYNKRRRHSALGNLTMDEFAAQSNKTYKAA